jgi:hypothetical protein
MLVVKKIQPGRSREQVRKLGSKDWFNGVTAHGPGGCQIKDPGTVVDQGKASGGPDWKVYGSMQENT